jgi:cytochrome c553
MVAVAFVAVAMNDPRSAASSSDPTGKWVMLGDSSRGELLFVRSCAACHGRNGSGAGAVQLPDVQLADLRARGFMHCKSAADIYRVIRDGGPPHGLDALMLPAGERLTEEDVRDLAAFVARLPLIEHQRQQRRN